MNLGAWVTLVATLALLVANYRKSRVAEWIAKPIAATGFVVSALQHGALGSPYGVCVLVALCLSWWGDVLLIPRTSRTFLAGLGAFLLGHVAYAVAFAARGVSWLHAGAAAAALVPALFLIGRWLLPHVKGPMKKPVLAYMIVIATMVALAVGTFALRGNPLVLVAAIGFFVSDLSVARDRFIAPGFVNKLWGAPLYFGAQLVFAATLA
jgi:uncharacterized membrane protein YhhN